MDLMEAIRARHSVRSYRRGALPEEIKRELCETIGACNAESGLHMQLITGESEAFAGGMAHYGRFSGVENYIAVVGGRGTDELCGYYGEQVVLLAQRLGLNTCWVAQTFRRGKAAYTAGAGERLRLVIALGYGVTQGVPHKSKPEAAVSRAGDGAPDWFRRGVEAALLAPTAVNQQKFTLSLEEGGVSARAGVGFYSRVDLGIVKYHFEIGAGKENFRWV